jgi:hypothetical protein
MPPSGLQTQIKEAEPAQAGSAPWRRMGTNLTWVLHFRQLQKQSWRPPASAGGTTLTANVVQKTLLEDMNGNFLEADFHGIRDGTGIAIDSCELPRSTALFSEIQSSFCDSGARFVILPLRGQSESSLR